MKRDLLVAVTATVLTALFYCIGCILPGPSVVPQVTMPAGGTVCAQLVKFGCAEGQPTDAGTTCDQAYAQWQDAGFVPLPADCILAAQSLSYLQTVCNVCK
jgi:hypothetical protein